MNYHPQSYSGDSPVRGYDGLGSRQSIMRSSDVVKEAKEWSEWKARSTAMTRRPFTPKDDDRRLFGQTGNSYSSRPPSAISISSRLFDPTDPDSRPGSAAPHPMKLTPLAQAPTLPEGVEPVPPKLPVPPNFNKSDLPSRPSSKSRLPRKTHSGGSSPMKAFHMEGVAVNVTKIGNDPRGVKQVREEYSGNEFGPDSTSKIASGLKTKVNINLSNLYGKDEKCQEKKSSASSTSSSGGSFAEPHQSRAEKSSGSVSGATDETPEQAKYWNQNVLPLMEALEDRNKTQDEVYGICKELHCILKEGGFLENLLGRRRTSLLSTLFKLLNSNSSSSHLICAKIILDLRVRRQNLNSLCKMLYKISREKKYDEEYVENELIESMLAAIGNFSDPLENYEILVYLTGTVKFLSENKMVAKDLVSKKCPQCFIDLMGDIMVSLKEQNYSKKEKLHATDILIQITAVLRGISDIDRTDFIRVNMFNLLIQVLGVLGNDESLALNISRIISKFTMFDEVFPEIMEIPTWTSAILTAAAVHKKCLNVVIRLFFALGNLTAKEEDARLSIHNTILRPSSANKASNRLTSYLSVTNCVLDIFIETVSKQHEPGQEQDDYHRKCLDTINKVIRVVANMAISEVPGREIACDKQCVDNLLKVLRLISPSESEELVINTLTALNNLSFYNSNKTLISHNRIEIANVLIHVLMNDSLPCIMEAVRVFGNVSRYEDVLPLLHSKKIDLMLVTLLDSKTWQMVYSACGVLINVSTEQANRKCLIKEGIINKLLDVLQHFVPSEWHVCGVACQLLWNLCDDGAMTSKEADSILQVLHAYMQDDAPLQLLDTSEYESDFVQYILESWKSEFVPVASRLYQKISAQHSQLQPL